MCGIFLLGVCENVNNNVKKWFFFFLINTYGDKFGLIYNNMLIFWGLYMLVFY